jgi:two-component system nitrate/nitrite sensor histidine kinase NarX
MVTLILLSTGGASLEITVLFTLIAVGLAAVAIFFAGGFLSLQSERLRLQKRVSEVESQALKTNQRLSTVLRLSQKFVEANDEREIIEQVIALSSELVGAVAASLVPLDERGQPLAAVSYGDLPAPLLGAWVEYLASPGVRHTCGTCDHYGTLMRSCPLLEAPLTDVLKSAPPVEIYCLPLRRGDREFGVLNLYLPTGHKLDSDTQVFLKAILDETSLALESIRLRQRELAALSQLRAVNQRTDLTGLLQNFLEQVKETLDADFSYLVLKKMNHTEMSEPLITGKFPETGQAIIDGLLGGVIASGKPVLLGNLASDPHDHQEVRALMIAPLVEQDGNAIGVVLAGNRRTKGFTQRQLALLETLATQATLVIQNSELLAESEFKTVMAERSRLAREIHDGLAQTLGFLKLQIAQMQNFMASGNLDRLGESLQATYKILSDVYLDARQAIDGLRISPTREGLPAWLEQTAVEFQENSALEVVLLDVQNIDGLAPEVQVQLIRIVQEALSNVRKHAQATRAWISCRSIDGDLILEVRDDGRGFSPEDVPGASQYGLKGMRERTELIGAEFQVISRPREGTTVLVRLPAQSRETIL